MRREKGSVGQWGGGVGMVRIEGLLEWMNRREMKGGMELM